MQVRNNYELDIFNGDLGRITAIDFRNRRLTVEFDGRPVEVASDGLEDVIPAYACTIHKSQGSEYPAVVIVLHHQHHIMLQRNLLYTAITRGRKLVVIVGSRRALARAVFNAEVRTRYTALAERLRDAVAAIESTT
jgi:exodeoxyribonuclease V alpha subunit